MKEKLITNFAIDLEDSALEQFNNCIKEDFVIAASLMPDAHSGYVAPIGSVLVTKDYIVPSWVGYDIGCGMIAVKFTGNKNLLQDVKDTSVEIYKTVNKIIPMGKGELNNTKNISEKTLKEFDKIFEPVQKNIQDKNFVKSIKSKAIESLGTLGSGNHFIELSTDKTKNKPDEVWLVIHSGSRNVGHKIATEYMKKASGVKVGFEKTSPLKHDSKDGKEYLILLEFCLEYALLNRLEMAYKVHKVLKSYIDNGIKIELWINKNHNHALETREEGKEKGEKRRERGEEGKEKGEESLVSNPESQISNPQSQIPKIFVHRKGATPAKLGERGVIPGNMRDGSFLVEGYGNKAFLESSSHGAGRVLSRKKAKEKISMTEFKESMKGIVGTIRESILDESPHAYKNIFDVMDAQKESVKIVSHLSPIINWKG